MPKKENLLKEPPMAASTAATNPVEKEKKRPRGLVWWLLCSECLPSAGDDCQKKETVRRSCSANYFEVTVRAVKRG